MDKELLQAFEAVAAAAPPQPPARGDWAGRRVLINGLYDALGAAAPPEGDVDVVDFTVPSSDGHAVALRMYKPSTTPEVLVVYVHGGGLLGGSLDGSDHVCRRYAAEAGVAVVSVGYRLSPEAPFPSAVEDCVAAVRWAVEHARERVPGARVAIMGESAGGGLAATTALACRDGQIGPLAAQILVYPMLDDRTATASPAAEPFLVWSVDDNVTGWKAYLGDAYGADDLPATASIARAQVLGGLPAAYLEVGELDLFCAETITFGKGLIEEGVSVRLSVLPGAYHGFDQLAPESRIARQAFADRIAFLQSL
ncbi:alpha/beta hydrolase [Promicromonospora sp. CA-289599]|uniref:alpha/beta hydrolase n=1 Tax=Promicromonospora sp. CA-289599 TaxID=3240014 RepID=UPI003D944BFA